MRSHLLATFALIAVPAAAQGPFITPRGVVNAATFLNPGQPNGSIARGSMFTIFGTNLGPATVRQVSAFPLQTSLDGVSIRVRSGTAGVDALPVFVSARQINAIMPSDAPTGRVSVQVTFNNQRSNPVPTRVAAVNFGAFSVAGGVGPGIFQNFVSPAEQPINNGDTSARRGQAATLWGTGLGRGLSPDNGAPQPGDLPTRVEVLVGGRSARRLYSGRSPCCSGIDQIVFEVPPDAPLGCSVPVHVLAEGTVSNVVTIAISEEGGPCRDAGNPLTEALRRGGKVGALALVRSILQHEHGLSQPGQVTTDAVMGTLREERGGPFAFNPLFAPPPPGTCASYGATGDLTRNAALPGSGSQVRFLDAGSIFTLIGPRGARTLTKPRDPALNTGVIGSNIAGSSIPSTLFLEPGDYTFTTGGGADIQRLSASFPLPGPLNWVNASEVREIDRSLPLTLRWTGGPSTASVLIIGASVDLERRASGLMLCSAPVGATNFTVPAYALANLPAGRGRARTARGVFYLGVSPLSTARSFSAAGLDQGLAFGLTLTGKTVALY